MSFSKFLLALIICIFLWTIFVMLAVGIPYQTIIGVIASALSDAWYFAVTGLYGVLLAAQAYL
jgi:hypothetical protein